MFFLFYYRLRVAFLSVVVVFTAKRLTQLVEMSDNRVGDREFEPCRDQHTGFTLVVL